MIRYQVDLDSYDCTCISFPIIRFCKHICAVQKQFPETVKLIPHSALAIPPPSSPAHSHIDDENPNSVTVILDQATNSDSRNDDPDIIAEIGSKLQDLANRFCFNPPAELSESLHCFDQHLDKMISDLSTTSRAILPPRKKIAPNQNSWTETAAIMGVPVKSKRKTNTDPYCGGERSGKKAKPDARIPLTGPPYAFTFFFCFVYIIKSIILLLDLHKTYLPSL